MTHQIEKKLGWRDYQAKLQKKAAKKRLFKKVIKFTAVPFLLLVAACLTISCIVGSLNDHIQPAGKDMPHNTAICNDSKPIILNNHISVKKDLLELLDEQNFINLTDSNFSFNSNGVELEVDLSLDVSLQNFILKKLNTATSRYIGIVTMDPLSGRILSLASYNKASPSANPCTDTSFPAASIFKIVTAAAAIEKCGFSSESKFSYNGRKHTLYKSQLKNRTNRYTNFVTLKQAFAKSINPVFGKIGIHYLGKSPLLEYADAFGFNKNIDFEIPLAPSRFSVSDRPYNWAEAASGFNNNTAITPIHGAIMASIVINHGRFVKPSIVDRIIDNKGQTIYKNSLSSYEQVISPHASRIINDLMKATIRYGTCRKTFRGYRKDNILSRLNIGGKTGSIDNRKHDVRYDWFVGFAEEKDGSEKIVISAVVAHEKYIGTRAAQYARFIIKQYFNRYFAKNKEEHKTDRPQKG